MHATSLWARLLEPDLSAEERIDGLTKHAMTVNGSNVEWILIHTGITLPTGIELSSGRKLIVVADRVSLDLAGDVQKFGFEDSELLEFWFHETACHAGFDSRGKSTIHGARAVVSCAMDVQRMFPNSTTVQKIFEEYSAS
jgi:hypothetical protein